MSDESRRVHVIPRNNSCRHKIQHRGKREFPNHESFGNKFILKHSIEEQKQDTFKDTRRSFIQRSRLWNKKITKWVLFHAGARYHPPSFIT